MKYEHLCILYLKSKHVSDKRTIIKCIMPFHVFLGSNTEVKLITPQLLHSYFTGLKKHKLSPNTIYNYYRYIKSLFKYAVDHNIINVSPFAFIPIKKKHRVHRKVLNVYKLKRLLCAYEKGNHYNGYYKARNRVILGLLIYCGLRTGEVARLRMNNINLKDNYIKIEHDKLENDRIIPIGEPLICWIKEYLYLRIKWKSDYFILADYTGDCIARSTVSLVIRKIRELANINKELSPLLLRHTFASVMHEAGADLDILKRLMGHHRLEQTAVYIKVSLKTMKTALLKNPLIKQFATSNEIRKMG